MKIRLFENYFITLYCQKLITITNKNYGRKCKGIIAVCGRQAMES